MKTRIKKRTTTLMMITTGILALLALGIFLFIHTPQFGRHPEGERKARILRSPNYRDGSFQNREETPQITSDKGYAGTMWKFLFALAKHQWSDPLVRVAKAADEAGMELLTPMIGQKLGLKERTGVTKRWWEGL